MNKEEIAKQVEEIYKALNEKVEKKEVEQVFRENMKKISGRTKAELNELKRMVIKHFGGEVKTQRIAVLRKLSEVKETDKNIEFIARVVSINPKKVVVEGKEKEIFYGIFGDETATKTFTAWKDFKLKKGDVIKTTNAYVKIDGRGNLQINLGDLAEISQMDRNLLPKVEKREKDLAEIKPNEKNFTIKGRILSINPKEITTASGEKKTTYYGLIGDKTAVLPFTSWIDFSLNKGDVVKIKNAYSTEWKEKLQINLSAYSEVEKLNDEEMPSSEIHREITEIKVKDFDSVFGRIAITGKIMNIEKREVVANNERKTIFSGVIGDDTGIAKFTAWKDFKLKANDVVKISNAYIRKSLGVNELSFDENASVEKLECDINVAEERKISISELLETEGAYGIAVEGRILDIKEGSGLIFRCPDCRRAITASVCATHGKVKGIPDLRTKAVIDDGFATISALFNRKTTEKLLGMNLQHCIELTREVMDNELIKKEIEKKFIGMPIIVKGRTFKDDFGMNLISSDAEFVKKDVREDAKKMLEEMEVRQ